MAPLMARVRRGDRNPALGGFLELAISVWERIRDESCTQRTWISLVRDPMAREISNIVQNPWLIGCDSDANLAEAHLPAALARLHDPASYDYVLNWFDREFLPAAGVNVFRLPFDQSAGVWVHALRPRSGQEQVILMQIEALDRLDATWWEQRIGFGFTLERSNELSDRPAAAQAFSKAMKAAFKPSRELLDHVYGSRLMRHFYGPEQCAAFRARWE
ncbi:putative capsular polysaccharide synthesis family protein [Piscinibacter sakaiensis]|uniref:putative capsular polysaccharide synthesis family protein n=1 Tax=Piscinibacter sakaiensis TaxID=1547922 RepID=UPI00372CA51D